MATEDLDHVVEVLSCRLAPASKMVAKLPKRWFSPQTIEKQEDSFGEFDFLKSCIRLRLRGLITLFHLLMEVKNNARTEMEMLCQAKHQIKSNDTNLLESFCELLHLGTLKAC